VAGAIRAGKFYFVAYRRAPPAIGSPEPPAASWTEARTLLEVLGSAAAARFTRKIDMRHANRPSGPNKPTTELSEAVTEQEERQELEAGEAQESPPSDAIEIARHAQRNARTRSGSDRGRTRRRSPDIAPGATPPEGPSTAEISDTRRWLVVADEGVARIYEKPPMGGDLEAVTELTDEDAHAHRADLRRDAYGRRGAGGRSGSSVTSAASDDELHREGARFAARIAQWLAEALAQQRYDELRIAAAPRFLGQLRKALDKQVGSVVAEEIAKDFTHEGARELTERFFPPPAPRRTT
jgi:protein required for attachment to host cells